MPTTKPARSRTSAAVRKQPARSGRRGRQQIDLALQGGGSHDAFSWGVLDRLLEVETLEIAAISGTSAGAMNAVALAAGLMEGGRDGARKTLRRLWRRVSELSPVHYFQDGPLGFAFRAANPWMAPWLEPVRHFVDPWLAGDRAHGAK